MFVFIHVCTLQQITISTQSRGTPKQCINIFRCVSLLVDLHQVGVHTAARCFKPKQRGVNYSEKSVRRFLGLENPGNFSWDSGIFPPKFKGF